MGAVIGMRDVTSDRKKLIDIGAAGPLAGLLVAVPVIWYGLRHSQVGPLSPTGLQEGNSILYALLKHAVKGIWLPDGKQDIFLHPTAWAGWAGLLVTMLNLIPIGQLDGGHVAAAYFGNRYNRFASRLHRPLAVWCAGGLSLGLLRLVRLESGEHWNLSTATSIALGGAFPWLVVYLVLRIVRALSGGDNHPPVDDQPLPRSRRLLFWSHGGRVRPGFHAGADPRDVWRQRRAGRHGPHLTSLIR